MASFTNQATLSYNGNVTNSNITTGELVAVLSATKSAVMDDYTAHDDVTYVISIVNAGNNAYNGLTITDNLGAYQFNSSTLVPLTYEPNSIQFYTNGVLQSAPTVAGGPPLVISGINVPANGNVTLIYEASVNEYAPLDSSATIVNTAVVSGGGLTSNISVSETINAQDDANLIISKSMCPTTVTENGQLTYTFTIQNTGNTAAVAADNVVLTDTFSPALNISSVLFNGTAWVSPTNYTYDASTGAFATVAGQITVDAATYTQNSTNGNWITTPGVSILTVTGTI